MKPQVLLLTSAVLSGVLSAGVPAARDTTATVSEAGPAVDGFLLSDPPSTLYFDFDSSALTDDGQDSDFWIDLVGQSFPATTVFPGVAPGGRATGGYANGSGNQDSSHPTVVMSSPSFELVPEMAVNFIISGGQGSAGTVAADLASVPAASANSGFQGLALRRVSDGTYLLSARRSGNSNADQIRTFSRSQIDAIRLANPGEKFTLDWVDYYHGSWGFASIDEVSVTVGVQAGNVPLVNPPTVLSGVGAYGTDINGLLNDPYDYQPVTPTSPLPDRGFDGADGFHNNSSSVDVILVFDLATPLVVDASTILAFDLYGRNNNKNRDNDIDVAFLDSSDGVLGELTGLAIPDSGAEHLRVFSDEASVANGSEIAKIRVIGHDSDGTAGTNNFTLMEVRAAEFNADYTAAYLVGGTASNLGLATPTLLDGQLGFGATLVGVVNDGFSYDPANPTAVLPDQNFNGSDGFHNNNTNTDATLLFALNTATAVGDSATIMVDLYGRNNFGSRDNDIDIAFLDASDVVLGELTGEAIPDSAPWHLRVSSADAGVSGTVAKIRVIGHDSDGTPATSNSFTLMEARAALVLPGNPAKRVVEVNGAAGNVGSQFTLPSGALLTVDSGGKFSYDPNGVFDVPTPGTLMDSFTYGVNYGGTSTQTGTVDITITDADFEVYVDDDWAAFSNGQAIADADLGTAGAQPATFGTDAFATVGGGTSAASAGATIIVNAGTYTESVGLSLGKVLETDGAVTVDTLGVSGGATVAVRESSDLVVTISSSITGADSVLSIADLGSFDCPTTGLSTGGGMALAGSATVDAGAITSSGAGAIDLGGTSGLTFDSGTVGVAVTGTGTVVKNTAGQATINAANSSDGGMTINGGRVTVSGAGTLGVGGVTVNDLGQIFLTTSLTADVAIQGDGWVEGAGQLGAIRFGNGVTLTGDVTVDAAGARIVAYSGAVAAIDGDLLGSGDLEINFGSNASANGTVSLLGSGSSHNGTVTISRGRFNMGSALGGSVVVEDAGTLADEGAITGNLQLGSTGGGGATLVIDADTGGTISAADLTLEGVSNLSVAGSLTPGGIEDVLTYSGTLTDVNGGTLTDSFSVSGGGALRSPLITDNAKTLQLGGANESMLWTADTNDDWTIGVADDNWSSSDGYFFNADTVTFDDSVNVSFGGTVTAIGTPMPADTIFNNSTVAYEVVGAIGGTGSLIKNGTETVSLASQHSFTGGTTVNAGVLDLTGGGGGSGTIRGTATVTTGGILRASSGDVTGYNNNPASLQTINLTGGSLDINTTSNQTLGNATINMTGGMITGVAGSNIDFFQGGSTLNVLASPDSSVISGTRIRLRQNGGLICTVADGAADGDLVVDSIIQLAGGFTDNNLTKAGPGKMVLNATNIYSTKTIINEGTLSLGVSTAIPDGNTVDINGSAVLDLDFVGGAEAIGVLNIDGIPVADGIYGATGSGAFIIDDVHFSGTGRLLVGAYPYDTWESDFSIVGAGRTADSDSDGNDNLLEFAFGTNPTVIDAGTLDYDGFTVTPGSPDIHVDFHGGGGLEFKARFMRRKDHGVPGSVSYAVRFSSDMTDWEVSSVEPTVVADAGDYELVEIPHPLFVGGKKARFFQVIVTDL